MTQFCENASYYIFFKAQDGAFEAVPVSEWYNFSLQAKYKALTAEEAEAAYEQRSKILNYSSLMKSMKSESGDGGEDQKANGNSFRVTDDFSDGDEDADLDDEAGPAAKEKGKGKGKGKAKRKVKKESDDDNSDPGEESGQLPVASLLLFS